MLTSAMEHCRRSNGSISGTLAWDDFGAAERTRNGRSVTFTTRNCHLRFDGDARADAPSGLTSMDGECRTREAQPSEDSAEKDERRLPMTPCFGRPLSGFIAEADAVSAESSQLTLPTLGSRCGCASTIST